MGMAFLAIGVIPDIAGAFALFIALYAISYFLQNLAPIPPHLSWLQKFILPIYGLQPLVFPQGQPR